MANISKTIIKSDVKIKGDIFEKEDILIDGNIEGNINANKIEVNNNGKIKGNIKSSSSNINGILKGNMDSEKVHISKSGDVEGNIKQKILSIEEGAKLKIKTETIE